MRTIQRQAARIVKNERPEVVEALLVQMADHIEAQKKQLDELWALKRAKEQEMFEIEEQAKHLRRMMFGRKSDERVEASDRPRDKSQEEALLFSQAAFPAPETRDPSATKSSELSETVIDHQMNPDELEKESAVRGFKNTAASHWKEIGIFDQSVKIEIIERRYIKEKHRRFKYKYVGEESPEKDIIVTAPGPDELLKGMNYTTSFVAAVVSDKYISHMPIERQTREMESLGLLGMRNSTLSRLCALAASALEPIQEKVLNEDLLRSDLALHLDETSWRIQKKEQKDGHMWVVSNRYGSYYFYKPTRSGSVIREKLQGYTGPVVTDGYGGYNALSEEGIAQAFCWAHARREFLPLEGHDPTIKPILDLIDELFAIEREAKDFEQLKRLRHTLSREVVGRLKALLVEEYQRSRPKSHKRKAIEYIQKRWPGFEMFVCDVRIPLSNNEAERTIRHAVMGRKNYYGSATHSGAETAATLFTVIESAKKNDIDPRSFLLMSLKHAAAGRPLETPLEYARRIRQHAK